MASYVITNNGNSFLILKGEKSNPYSRNDLRLKFSSDEDQVLKIYDKSVNNYLIYQIDLRVDTVDVGGVTSFADAQELFQALEPIFFLTSFDLSNQIIVNQSNVSTTLGGVIDSTKEYFLDGVIDLGTTQITVPPTGITLRGYSFDLSGLTSSEDNYTMFISESIAIGSGNILGFEFYISVTGSSSKVYEIYDATGFNAFEFTRVNYIDCTNLGDIYDYRQGLELGTGRFGGSPSLTLHGLWRGGYRITTSIVRSLAGTMTEPLFKEGILFQMNSRFLTDINVDLPTLSPLLDFQPLNFPNDSTLQLQGCLVTRNGASVPLDSNITPNVSESDLCSNWKGNTGLNNTFVGGTIVTIAEVETTINTVNVWETLVSTTLLSNPQHVDSPSNGQLRNLGTTPREFEITANLNIDGGPNDDLEVRFVRYDNSTTTNIPLDYTIQRRPVNNFSGGRDVAFFILSVGALLDINDYLFIEVRNITDDTNVTLENGSFFRIQER